MKSIALKFFSTFLLISSLFGESNCRLSKNKFINLSRSKQKFSCLEQATIVDRQGESENQKFVPNPTQLNRSLLFANGINRSDHFQFGKFWRQIKQLDEATLFQLIGQRKKEIREKKEYWREKIDPSQATSFYRDLYTTFSQGVLHPVETGSGSAYFLFDSNLQPRFVIKPLDEDLLCLNHRKHSATPFNQPGYRVRDHIPLYRSAQAEALAYSLASLLGWEELTPETHLALLTHDQFFDLSDHLAPEYPDLLEKVGTPDREKLCSVQSFRSDIINLYQLVHHWLEEGFSEQEVLSLIDQRDFENLTLLIWLLYDTDAHAGNLYAYLDEKGGYHLLKLDNGLTFPTKNSHLLNALFFFPHANFSPSEESKIFIENLPLDKIWEHFDYFGMEEAWDAFFERVEVLRYLFSNRHYTFREIDMRLRTLDLPDGREIALSHISLNELENLISYE